MSDEMKSEDVTLSPRTMESRAEVLMAMDVLMKHLNDENDQEVWLMAGVPDGAPPLRMTIEQLDYYRQFVDGFEEFTRLFATIVRRTCFKTKYEPKGFC